MPLWFQTTQIARPNFYDRNPRTGMLTVNIANVAPHGLTLRATYTVPGNKKAWLDSIWTHIVRSAAAAPSQVALIRVTETTSFSGAQVAFFNYFTSGAVLGTQSAILANDGFLASGDNIQVSTIDGSTGGSCDYDFSVKYTEFDL